MSFFQTERHSNRISVYIQYDAFFDIRQELTDSNNHKELGEHSYATCTRSGNFIVCAAGDPFR
jgi:hypothetical protein